MSGRADRILGPVEQLLACTDLVSLEETLIDVVRASTGATAVELWRSTGPGSWDRARPARAWGDVSDRLDPRSALALGSQALLPSGWWLSRSDSLAAVYAAWCEEEQRHAEIDALVTLAGIFGEELTGVGPSTGRGRPETHRAGADVPDALPVDEPPSLAVDAAPRAGIHLSRLLAPWARLDEELAARLADLAGPPTAGARELAAAEPITDGAPPTLRLGSDGPEGLEILVEWPESGETQAATLSGLASLLGQLVPDETRVEVPKGAQARLRIHR
ncbi:MAG: hypothetical protein AAFZ65_04515 [Planctomycetota bacterium]